MSDDTDKSPVQQTAEQATDAANEGATTSQRNSPPQGHGPASGGPASGDADSGDDATDADEGAPGPAEQLDPGEEGNTATNAAVE